MCLTEPPLTFEGSINVTTANKSLVLKPTNYFWNKNRPTTGIANISVPCGCGALGMGGDRTLPMWVLFMLLLAHSTYAICPSRCQCNDDVLQASCVAASLKVVPIQLNPEVRHINLSNNKIDNVHFTLRIYYNLITLDLSSNKIQTLGNSNFEFQRHLKHLNLSDNEIDSLTKDSFKGLRNLTELDLSYNRLEELPSATFHELHSLQVLRLTNNLLVFLEEDLLTHAKQLRELILDDNQILEMPGSAIGDAINLQILSLSRNLVASIDDGDVPTLSELRVLLLDTNVINDIQPGALAGLASLEELNLNDNNFTGNFIRSVPPVAFRGLFQLRYLRLDRLDVLARIDSRAFVDNIYLEKVWLDDNVGLYSLPTRLFYGNPRVTHISIRNNQLVTLEVSHFPLDQLKSLKLGGNPFQCNCSLLWLWRLQQEQVNRKSQNNDTMGNDLIIDTEYIKCAGPEALTNVLLVDASESQVDCSLGWIAAVSAALFACLLLATASTLLYLGPMRRRLNKRELPQRETAQCPDGATLTLTYDDPRVDKYIIGPPLIHEYRTLPPWDTFATNNDMEIYRQFDANVKTRPHIVYV
ncbi:hypothetical protein RN001_015596 [Aquatica leii]|uniref:LRRCT domain-containing protein n=1 Tax=Aquatica leii TaxID=1421715 RepID=A0AAN7SAQ2_9COLE|nr:hypothetical protein RN001_015596 [Aquatica leii]